MIISFIHKNQPTSSWIMALIYVCMYVCIDSYYSLFTYMCADLTNLLAYCVHMQVTCTLQFMQMPPTCKSYIVLLILGVYLFLGVCV